MCPRPAGAPAPPPAEAKTHFFDHCCLSYWTLRLINGDGQVLVDGVDVITFDENAKVILKDAIVSWPESLTVDGQDKQFFLKEEPKNFCSLENAL